ncbi:recombinase family protein [Sulfitobacter sp. SK011]|uniref:recombinase family protein n=1 Tax=Sulfitobacter sp. SK011 TaxID=1389004 RepID=UPI000E0A782F|nr:recombinase family protein [Sulfitobacter sp. SK011]AXI40709.1 recombinase family protein [Sulfitobacter sp. SK011]
MTTCFGYTRVSTAKQGEGVSLEVQKEEITRYAEKHGLTISRWFEEKETAAKSGRPVFNAIMRDLNNHKADGLIVHKIDRSARNFRDWAKIGELSDQGVAIHFVTESLDFQSRGGRLTADIQAVIASDYIRNLREEAIKGIRGRLKQGLYPHMAPLGYLNQGGGNPKTPDPARAPLITDAFTLYGTGKFSIRGLCDEMDKRGLRSRAGKALTRTSMEQTLSNPFYCGIVRVRKTGETFKGVHQPLIPASLFQRVQDLKSDKYHRKKLRHFHTYRGLFVCAACSNKLIAERQKGHVYYRCHTNGCVTQCIREEIIEREVQYGFEQISFSKPNFERLKGNITTWFEDRRHAFGTSNALTLRKSEIKARIGTLTDALIDRLIDKEAFAERKQHLLIECQKIDDQLEKMNDLTAEADKLAKFLELVKSLAELYQIANPSEKRLIVELATSNRLVDGKNVALQPSNWLLTVDMAVTVLCGGDYRDTDRTPTQVHERQLEKLCEALAEVQIDDQLPRMMEIFDHYIGNSPISTKKKKTTQLGF